MIWARFKSTGRKVNGLMKKFIAAAAIICCGFMTTAYAEGVEVTKFTHQNVVGSQTCYSGSDLDETTVTELPDVIMGMRINNPIIRAYLTADETQSVTVKAEQYNKFGKLLKTDENTISVGTGETAFEFNRVRNADSVKLYADGEYIGGVNDSLTYENGVSLTEAPSDYQIYQRDENNQAVITLAGAVENSGDSITIDSDSVSVSFVSDTQDAVIIIADYNDDATLKGVTITPQDGSVTTVSSDEAYGNIKVMVWDGMDTMEPIYPSASNFVTVTAENIETAEITAQTVNTYGDFTAALTLDAGMYDISLKANGGVTEFKNVGVGDIWVAAGQSNMTDMGAITDGFNANTDDPITDDMHIIYAEDTTWQQMSHPAGEGHFFKTGTRTSPVTSFARIISEEEGVPVGIVQSSVGGTYIYQWAEGINTSDSTNGYLINAMKACFDNMPSTDIKGILWYQGCNDTMNESYAYDYERLQGEIFSQFREFFGEDTPIITTQINDAKQDSTSSLGYYDAWSYVKDIQRQNAELYYNVYVVGTGALDLGDTIHNSAKSNLTVGDEWARVALNRVYGKTDVTYLHPTIDTVDITDEHTLTLTFKNVGADGLCLREDTKRLGITNGEVDIALGDLTEEFTVRMGGNVNMTASNTGKGTTLTIESAELQEDGKTVILTIEEEMAGTIAVDCCYGKYFVPTLTDKATGWSVLAFYNVIADWGDAAVEVTAPVTYTTEDTALISEGAITTAGFSTLSADIAANTASSEYMYLNTYSSGNAYPLMKFDLTGIDTSAIQSATLQIYTNEINKDRNGNITISAVGTDWSSASTYSDYATISSGATTITTYEGVNTSAVFPTNNYSSIDVTDYIKSLESPEKVAFSAAATQVAVALMSGVDSDNPPQLVIQYGKNVSLAYTSDGSPVSGVKVTISGTGATQYNATTFETDSHGVVNAILTEGTYKAVTTVGEYLATENRFTVSDDDVSQNYSLTKNTQIPDKIVLSGGAETAAAGVTTEAFTAVLYDTEGEIIPDGAVWSWSCDKDATVEDGKVTISSDAEEDDVITLTVTATFNSVTVSATAEITVIGITSYGFGSEYVLVKDFTTSNMSGVAVGNSGIKASSTGGNYNCLMIRNSTSTNSGYWPYTSSFKADDDAYYLFAGAGGNNSSEVITLTFPSAIKAGKTITIKIAKPKATQKADTDRTSSNNALTVVIGSKTLDLQSDFEFDEWQTLDIISESDVSEITLNLGAWCAVAIESISIDGGEIPVTTPDPNATPAPEQIKVMPLGDSITAGYTTEGGYRNQLCSLLVENELSAYVDFVGSESSGTGYDTNNEGHSGWAIAAISASDDIEGSGRKGLTTNIDTWMTDYTPDIVMLQIGTNDILSQYDLTNAPTRLETLVDKVLAKLPEDGKMYIATIPYIDVTSKYNNTGISTQTEMDEIIDTYNAAVETLATSKELTLVDVNSWLTLSDLTDGVHPTVAGYAKMGNNWYEILESEITSRIDG